VTVKGWLIKTINQIQLYDVYYVLTIIFNRKS